jgi:HipA-like C-terminal domain
VSFGIPRLESWGIFVRSCFVKGSYNGFGELSVKRLVRVPVRRYIGLTLNHHKHFAPIRQNRYVIVDSTVIGEAPKNYIRIYEHGSARKSTKYKWTGYIAKVGHKAYPNESITEHLVSRIGQSLGLRMAETKLMRADNQLRFLSKDFLKRGESLVHGAQIFSSYLEDKTLVDEVQDERLESDLFTFQFICSAIHAVFPLQAEQIIKDFTKMLAFDAFVGNNDRHHWNWGVITDVYGARPPSFSPVYDSARALFWNHTEDKVLRLSKDANLRNAEIVKYAQNSIPMTGWEGVKKPNHFELLRNICREKPILRPLLASLVQESALTRVEEILHTEFYDLMSQERCTLIMDYLRFRLQHYNDVTKED